MHDTGVRPRNLRWFHAGPLLYGDWGTSRLYVLGLAFFYTAHASAVHLAAIGILMLAVAWAYTVVCRSFPEGGGVYSAARRLSPTVAVVGATLLLCGYLLTAVISAVEAFHYFGAGESWVLPLSALAIAVIATLNWTGAQSAGRFAMVVAFAAIVVSGIVALVCLPFFIRGVRTVSLVGLGDPGSAWVSFTRICLAMAGVEAVANMTGLMRTPVARTARRTIWPVAIEVVVLNMVFGLALAGLPALEHRHAPDARSFAQMTHAEQAEVREYRDTAMKVLARESGAALLGPGPGAVVGAVAAGVFGLLLLSAANTAIMAMVSVLFALAKDRELPRALTRLNYSGVPWVGLVLAGAGSLAVLAVEQDVQRLGELYVIGVCGAVTTSLLSCALDRRLELRRGERRGLWAVGLVLAAVTLTIVVTLPWATLFAATMVFTVLALRLALRAARRGEEAPPLPEPVTGWLAEVNRAPRGLAPGRPRLMLAARGRDQAEFAVDLARRRNAALFTIFVRTLRLMDVAPGGVPRIEEDREAQEALGTAALLAHRAGVPFVPIYVVSADVVSEILDYTVTFGCDTLILGKSQRTLFSRRVAGDVVSQVAAHLPAGISLLTRAPGPFERAQEPQDEDHGEPPPS